MTEKVLEKPICETCGADVRPGSLFCYNCGGAISETISKVPEKTQSNGSAKSGEAGLREVNGAGKKGFSEINKAEINKEDFSEAESAAADSENYPAAEDKSEIEKTIRENEDLRSAAAMRRKPKTFQKQKVEVVWEPVEHDSNVKLALIAVLLTIFAAVIVWLALYLK